MNIENFRNQSYTSLKKKLLKDKALFEDPLFPADSKSIYLKDKPEFLDGVRLTWKRPFELHKSPKFAAEGFSRKDLHQGIIGPLNFCLFTIFIFKKFLFWIY